MGGEWCDKECEVGKRRVRRELRRWKRGEGVEKHIGRKSSMGLLSIVRSCIDRLARIRYVRIMAVRSGGH